MARPKQLPVEIVEEIRKLYRNKDCTQSGLAKLFGISQSTICKIVNNYIHKTVTNVVMGGEADVRIGYKHSD